MVYILLACFLVALPFIIAWLLFRANKFWLPPEGWRIEVSRYGVRWDSMVFHEDALHALDRFEVDYRFAAYVVARWDIVKRQRSGRRRPTPTSYTYYPKSKDRQERHDQA